MQNNTYWINSLVSGIQTRMSQPGILAQAPLSLQKETPQCSATYSSPEEAQARLQPSPYAI